MDNVTALIFGVTTIIIVELICKCIENVVERIYEED